MRTVLTTLLLMGFGPSAPAAPFQGTVQIKSDMGGGVTTTVKINAAGDVLASMKVDRAPAPSTFLYQAKPKRMYKLYASVEYYRRVQPQGTVGILAQSIPALMFATMPEGGFDIFTIAPGGTKTVSGWKCDVVTVTQKESGAKVMEFCLSRAKEHMALLSALMSLPGPLPKKKAIAQLKANGLYAYPASMAVPLGDGQSTTIETVSIKAGPVDKALFQFGEKWAEAPGTEEEMGFGVVCLIAESVADDKSIKPEDRPLIWTGMLNEMDLYSGKVYGVLHEMSIAPWEEKYTVLEKGARGLVGDAKWTCPSAKAVLARK